MKTGRALNEVLTELSRQDKMKRDYIVPAREISLLDDGGTFSIGGLGDYFPTQLFHRQVGDKLGIPAKYYDVMREKKPELLARNVNAWLSDQDGSYMVRTIEGDGVKTARAFLSKQYRRIDNLQVAMATLPLFAGSDDYRVESCEVTPTHVYLKIVSLKLEAEVKVGDVVQAGVVISNSEVGLGSVSVQPLLYTLACKNGMTINSLGERKNHVGRAAKAVEDSYELYSDATLKAEDDVFLMKLKDVTLAAIEETRFLQAVDVLKEAAGIPITGKVQQVVELAGRNYGMNQAEQEGILKYLIEGGDLSKYGLSNAVTRMSQDVESYDRATQLEGMGWQVATMDRRLWEGMNG